MNVYGYSKISKIQTEVFKEPVGLFENEDGSVEVIEDIVYEIVWIEAEGALFSVSLLKGEILDEVAANYQVGGYTDDRCTFVRDL